MPLKVLIAGNSDLGLAGFDLNIAKEGGYWYIILRIEFNEA